MADIMELQAMVAVPSAQGGDHHEVMTNTDGGRTSTEQARLAHDRLFADYPLDLRAKQIRVLSIDGANRQEDGPITARMHIVDLDEAAKGSPDHKYTALSYVWGATSVADPTIVCHGTAVRVTKNCHRALWHLRRMLGSFTIWVDAVCIDQDDTKPELDQQIRLMTDIYGAASTVYIWLGASTKAELRAMSYLQGGALSRYVSQRPGAKVKERPGLAAMHLVNPWGTAYPSSKWPWWWTLGDARTTDIIALLENEWIERMWTYQEILFANNPVIVCGIWHVPYGTFQDKLLLLSSHRDKRLREIARIWLGLSRARQRLHSDYDPWKFSRRQRFMQTTLRYRFGMRLFLHIITAVLQITVFALLIDLRDKTLSEIALLEPVVYSRLGRTAYADLEDQKNAFAKASVAAIVTYVANVIITIVYIGFVFQQYRPPPSIGRIIDGICRRKARKQQDKVYGIFNILRKLGAQDLSSELPALGEKNEDLFWRLAVDLFKTTNETYVLLVAALSRIRDSDLPSWVPDWSYNLGADLNIEYSQLEINQLGYCADSERKYKEEAERHVVKISADSKIITVPASELGEIIACRKFDRINDSTEEDNIEKHVNNVKAGILLFRALRELQGGCRALYALAEPKDVTQLTDWEDLEQTLPGKNMESVEANLSDLAKEQRLPNLRPSTCIRTRVFNHLAKLGCTVCTVRFHDEPGVDTMAFCLRVHIEPRDRILRVKGLLRPLIVRRRVQSVASSVELVSTLYMKARRASPTDGLPRSPKIDNFDFH